VLLLCIVAVLCDPYQSLQGQANVETVNLHLTNDIRTLVRCFYLRNDRSTLNVEMKISIDEIYHLEVLDSSGFIIRTVMQSLQAKQYQALTKKTNNNSTSLQLVIDNDLEPLILNRVALTQEEEKEISIERIKRIDRNMETLFREDALIGVNVISTKKGASYSTRTNAGCLNNTIPIVYVQKTLDTTTQASICVTGAVETGITMPQIMDSQSQMAVSEAKITLAKPYHISNLLLSLSVPWLCRPAQAPTMMNGYYNCPNNNSPYPNQKLTIKISFTDNAGIETYEEIVHKVTSSPSNCNYKSLQRLAALCLSGSTVQPRFLDINIPPAGGFDPIKTIIIRTYREFGDTDSQFTALKSSWIQDGSSTQFLDSDLQVRISNIEGYYSPVYANE